LEIVVFTGTVEGRETDGLLVEMILKQAIRGARAKFAELS
jgi:hypothetical protein